MKKVLIFATLLLGVGLQIHGYKVKIFNMVPYTANFFVHTTLAGCCYGDNVGGESKCRRKAIGALKEIEINLSGLCTGACWSYVDASVIVPDSKEAYIKRSAPFENESLGCGDARLFVYKNNEGFALGNKAEYIAHLIAKLNTLLDDNVSVKPFLKELQLKYTNKVNELDTQIGTQPFLAGNLGISGIILAQNVLANTLEYAKEFLKIDEATQLVKKSANQDSAAKLKTLTALEINLNTIPLKEALLSHNQLIDTLRALIYIARLEIAAQNPDKTLLATEMNKKLAFPFAPAMAAEIKARIEATQKLYESNVPSANPSTTNIPRAQGAQDSSYRASLPNIDEDNEPALYTFWVTKLSLPMNDDNAKNDLCAIKKYIEKGIKEKGQLSADVPDLLEAIDEWKKSTTESLYPTALLNLINKKLADRKWQCF